MSEEEKQTKECQNMKLSECTGDDFLKDIELTSYKREKIFITDSLLHRMIDKFIESSHREPFDNDPIWASPSCCNKGLNDLTILSNGEKVYIDGISVREVSRFEYWIGKTNYWIKSAVRWFIGLPWKIRNMGKEEKMPKLEPDSVNPKCECGEYLESILIAWRKGMGMSFIWRCPECGKEESNE